MIVQTVKKHALAVVLAFAFIFRAATLHLRAPGIDEGFTLSWIASPDMLTLLIREGFTPPLYYVMASALSMAGTYAVALLSVFLGTASIAFFFLFARDVAGRRRALLAAFLLSILPLHVFYSQHMRTYALTIFLFSAVLYTIHRYVKKQGRRELAVLTGLNALLLYTNYVNGMIVLAELLSIAALRRSTALKGFLVSFLVSAFSLVPWLALVVRDTLPRSSWAHFDFQTVAYTGYKLLMGIDVSTLINIHWALLLTFPFIAGTAALGVYRTYRRGETFVLAFLFMPLAVSASVSLIQPITHFRFLSYMTLPLALVIANAAEGKRWILIAAVVMVWLVFDILYFGMSQMPGWNEAIGL